MSLGVVILVVLGDAIHPEVAGGTGKACFSSQGLEGPCGPGFDQCSRDGFGRGAPEYHIMDRSCKENDPNGLIYDPKHGIYHLFYQDHPGPTVYGHVVSRDFVHWARLPVAIWNDHVYDNESIFSGSATLVDGKMVQVYPGLCSKAAWPSCDTSFTLDVAVPADPNDPLATNWTKPSYNPIVSSGATRDPSTAWKTKSGEWRFLTYDTSIYGSMDFKSWYKIGPQPGFPVGECPSFFPLPGITPGSGPAAAGAVTPTHVHKISIGGSGDWMHVGTYTENGPQENGTWVTAPGVDAVKIDVGSGKNEDGRNGGLFYAGKDFWDPVKQRRILFGWAPVPPASVQTLPREITWNPELQQLVFSPVEEQDKLRSHVLGMLGEISMMANHSIVFPLQGSHSNQSEVDLIFARPSSPAIFGVVVMADGNHGARDGGSGTLFYVDYKPPPKKSATPAHIVYAGATSMPMAPNHFEHYMPHHALPDVGNYKEISCKFARECEIECDLDSRCAAWIHGAGKCNLKSWVGGPAGHPSWRTCGVKHPKEAPAAPPLSSIAELRLSPNDDTISIRVYVDNTVSEAFWQNGRVAMTRTTEAPASGGPAGIAVYSSAPVKLLNATAYAVKSIWVTPEDVLKTPRRDKPTELMV